MRMLRFCAGLCTVNCAAAASGFLTRCFNQQPPHASCTMTRSRHPHPARPQKQQQQPPLYQHRRHRTTTTSMALKIRNNNASHHERLVGTITLPAYCDAGAGPFDELQADGIGVPALSYPSTLHHIYVCSALSPDMAAQCLSLAQAHARRTGCWETADTDRHATYATCDFAVEDCRELDQYLQGHNEEGIDFHAQIMDDLSRLYNIPVDDMEYLDFFCAHYRARRRQQHQQEEADDERAGECVNETTALVTGEGMDRLEAHRDGSLLSYTVTLSPPTDFTGGGTFFDALRRSSRPEPGEGVVRPDQAGQAVLHCGKVFHGADVVTSGERTVLVGFVNVRRRRYMPNVLARACKEWGRMDEAKRRLVRQTMRQGKLMSLHRWLPNSVSVIRRGPTPAFRSVENRADVEFQRLQKLQAEDLFLRTALKRKKGAPQP